MSGEYRRRDLKMEGIGETQRTDLARTRIAYALPGGGISHQVSYRITSTGAQNQQPVFVEVGRGRGGYLWEDVNGDGIQDLEEFVPDLDGDYEMFIGTTGNFRSVREGALGARIELSLKRLLPEPSGSWQRFVSGISLETNVESDRQILPGYGGVAPWTLFSFRSGAEVLNGRRNIRTRLYFFRYHHRASLRVFTRLRDQVDGLLSDGGVETLFEVGTLGRYEFDSRFDLETEWTRESRIRKGFGPFAYGIHSGNVSTQGLWRPGRGWQIQVRSGLGWDRERNRSLKANSVSVQPQILRSLPGRGRLRGSLDWTQVSASGPLPLFLGMADGNRRGRNLIWRFGLDYKLSRYMTAQFVYDGRIRPSRPPVHLGRMEMRARF